MTGLAQQTSKVRIDISTNGADAMEYPYRKTEIEALNPNIQITSRWKMRMQQY